MYGSSRKLLYDVHFSMEGLIYETMSAYIVEYFDRAIMTWDA